MKPEWTSPALAAAAQAFFGVALAFLPWKAASLGALAISLAAVALLFLRPRKNAGTPIAPPFPLLELKSILIFSAMAIPGAFMKAEDLFPLTGVFFAAGMGCACIAETIYAYTERKGLRPFISFSSFTGYAYLSSAALQLAFFPRPAYLFWGVGLLLAVSAVDITRGIASACKSRRKPLKKAMTAALFITLTALSSTAMSESPAYAEDSLFMELFGEAPPEESPMDPLLIAAIAVERPECFTDDYVRSFARGLETGERMTRGELEEELGRAGRRLELSGMFYQSSASYKSAGTDAEGTTAVIVILSVSEGFWWGFNFGPWDLSLAYANLFRQGKQLALTAGLNTQNLVYADPAIAGGPFFFAIGAGQGVRLSRALGDRDFILQGFSSEGSLGYRPLDDLAVDIGLGSFRARSLPSYFLYPGIDAPSDQELLPLSLGASWGSTLSASAGLSAGSFSFKRRGGLKGRADVEGIVYFPLDPGSPSFRAIGSAALRYDAPQLFRAALLCELDAFPDGLQAGALPEPLWSRVNGYRGRAYLPSGEFAGLARLSASLDPVARFNLGFTTLSLVPEAFYEIAASKRSALSSEPFWGQDCGLLLKAAFSPPVGRTFVFGASMAIPTLNENSFRFVFEVE